MNDELLAGNIPMGNRWKFTDLLESIPIRVSITGTRGKSSHAFLLSEALTSKRVRTITKITGDNPFFMDQDGTHNIKRKSGRPVFLDETTRMVDLFEGADAPADAVIFENQAIQPYTMYAFHALYSKPTYISITNIRRDHLEFLGKTLVEIAHSYGKSLAVAKAVVSGDTDKRINAILSDYSDKIGSEFHVARMPKQRRAIPGVENIYLSSKIMELATRDFPEFGDLRMTGTEVDDRVRMIEQIIDIQPTEMGIDWFDGAKLNDIDSTRIMAKYLFEKNPDRHFTLLANFRADRPGRTISFVNFFNNMLDLEHVSKVFLTGPGADYVYKRIDEDRRGAFQVISDSNKSAHRMVKSVSENGRALFTMANAVSPFMRYVRSMLLTSGQQHTVYQKKYSEGQSPKQAS